MAARFMTLVTCRLTAKNRDQLRNPTLGNRVWATLARVRRWTYIEKEKAEDAFVGHDEECIASVGVNDRKPMHAVFVQHLYCFKQAGFRRDGHQRARVLQQLICEQAHTHTRLTATHVK